MQRRLSSRRARNSIDIDRFKESNMGMHVTRRTVLATLTAAIAGAPHRVFAQAKWPTRAVTLQVGYPSGGATDFGARIFSDGARAFTSIPFVVENRAGAAGTLAAGATLRSNPDGYTLFVGTSNETTMLKSIRRAPPYALSDFAPLAMILDYPMVLIVPASSPVSTWQDFLKAGKEKGDRMNYASPGVGSAVQFFTERVVNLSGLQASPIYYRGSTAAAPDILAGRVDFALDVLPTWTSSIRSGAVRAIAVSTRERLPQAPNIPSLRELGLPIEERVGWNGLFAPSKTPVDIQNEIIELARSVLQGPARPKIEAAGYRPGTLFGADFRAFIQQDEVAWEKLVKSTNFQPE